jgi:hypothetical protein
VPGHAQQGEDEDEQAHKNTMGTGSDKPDRIDGVEVDSVADHPATADTFESRRASSGAPSSLARCLAVVWRSKCVFIPSRWRRPISCRYRGPVSFDRDDPALGRVSDQNEVSITRPVVWSLFWRTELDCRTGRGAPIGSGAFLEGATCCRLEATEVLRAWSVKSCANTNTLP